MRIRMGTAGLPGEGPVRETERRDWMAYADQQMSGNRIVAIIIVALIHIAIGYALITGLAYSAVK